MASLRSRGLGWGGLAVACLAVAAPPPTPAGAYVIKPLPTLGFTAAESTHILLVRVEKVSREKGVVIYRKVRDLRGKYPKDTLKHAFNLKDTPAVAGSVFRPEVEEWGYVLHWAELGKEAVVFIRTENNGGDCSHTYVDQCWYAGSSPAGDGVWFHALRASPDMLRTYYCGSPARLAVAVEAMLARGANLDDHPVVPTLGDGTVADLRLAGRGKVRGLRVGVGRNDVDLKRDVSDAWEDPKAAEGLVKRLGDKDQAVRLQAARELAHWFGPEGKAAVPALIAALKHDDATTRRAAAVALANPHLDAAAAVPALCAALKDKDAEVGVRAAEALCALRDKAKAALPALREAMKGEGAVGEASAAALVTVDPDVEAAVPAVTAVLQRRASVGGTYTTLRERIKVPQDLVARQFLRDQAAVAGVSPAAAEYRGHKNLPKGYWVYAHPYWYIWGERAAPK